MYSPFYIAEQKMLYPHRKLCRNLEETKQHFDFLIKNNIVTFEEMSKQPLGALQHKYFINASTFTILECFNLYRQANND